MTTHFPQSPAGTHWEQHFDNDQPSAEDRPITGRRRAAHPLPPLLLNSRGKVKKVSGLSGEGRGAGEGHNRHPVLWPQRTPT